MSLILRALTWSSKKPAPLQTHRLSPLCIPELLELIFSFLSDHTLHSCAALVCRQWRAVATPLCLTQRAVIWWESPDRSATPHDKVFQRLHDGAQSLVVQSPRQFPYSLYISPLHESSQPWMTFKQHLADLASQNRLAVKELQVLRPMLPDEQLRPLLAMMGPQLTSLQLHNMNYTNALVDEILVLCPGLIRLQIHHSRTAYFRSQDLGGNARPTLPDRLRLRSLTLAGMGIEKKALTRLLASCPDLYELRLMHMLRERSDLYTDNPIGPSDNELVAIFQGTFLEEVTSLCPKLTSTHFSGGTIWSWGVQTASRTIRALELFPLVNEWSFVLKDCTRSTFKALRKYQPNNLRSLEIIDTALCKNGSGNVLHQYLCDSPNLLHLKAPDVEFSNVWFDLEGILETKGARHQNGQHDRTINPFLRKIWACRNLRTLHLSCDAGGSDPMTPESTRVFFGYLSKVCPQMEDLCIGRLCLSGMGLDTGVCLLMRMHRLRRLVLATESESPFFYWNLDWMARQMSSAIRMKIKMIISKTSYKNRHAVRPRSPFKPVQEMEQQSRLGSTGQKKGGVRVDILESQADYMIDGVDMRNVGRWQDAVDLLQNWMVEGWTCWREMEYFEVKLLRDDGLGFYETRAMMKKVKKYRPEIEVP